jgi:hypothetical protein
MALYKISSSRVNNIEATEYVGGTNEVGLIWYDETTGLLRLYNGEPGGRIINDGGGNITLSEISDGDSNVRVYPNGQVGISVNGVANVALFEGPQAQFDNVVSSGNVTASYFIGDGSQLTGLPAGYSDSNVTALLSNFGSNSVVTTGNITAGYFIGDGSQLTGIAAALPDQTGQQGKYLSTNGVEPSWQTVAGVFGLTIDGGDAAEASTDLVIDAGGA